MRLEITDYVLFAIGIGLFAYFVVIFNNLVSLKNNVARAWANIDVLLKQRNNELPKLVETCKQYMKYERETLLTVTEARTQADAARDKGDIEAVGRTEGILRATLGRLFALAEAYPALKANETFSHLAGRISALENSIADRRELYNESATLNNIRIEQFPDILIAKIFFFKSKPLLEFSKEEIADIDIKGIFKPE